MKTLPFLVAAVLGVSGCAYTESLESINRSINPIDNAIKDYQEIYHSDDPVKTEICWFDTFCERKTESQLKKEREQEEQQEQQQQKPSSEEEDGAN